MTEILPVVSTLFSSLLSLCLDHRLARVLGTQKFLSECLLSRLSDVVKNQAS